MALSHLFVQTDPDQSSKISAAAMKLASQRSLKSLSVKMGADDSGGMQAELERDRAMVDVEGWAKS